jgi:hypothetical protein
MGTRWLLTAALGCACLAGCAASDRAPDAAAVTERFYAALEQRDGAAACEQLSEETRGKLEQQEHRVCEVAIFELDLPRGGTAVDATAYVTSASVARAQGGTTFLDQLDDGWKISATGCVPTAPDLPYDCELEG